MRKPVYTICEQQSRRSACASSQSDHWPFSSCADWFVSYLVANPKDRFSRDEAHNGADSTFQSAATSRGDDYTASSIDFHKFTLS